MSAEPSPLQDGVDASRAAAGNGSARLCEWCDAPIPPNMRADARFHSKECRQWAFRLRRRRETRASWERGGLRFCYADPPYPGTARKFYRDEPTYAGEVDHAKLVAELVAGGWDGWALSTSARALRDVLPLCPAGARVCVWIHQFAPPKGTHGLHACWEPLIVVGGRQAPPGRRDYLVAHAARSGGDLVGRKPIAFWVWLFDCLGMRPGDSLADRFPGTDIGRRAWRELSRMEGGDASPLEAGVRSEGVASYTDPGSAEAAELNA